MAKYEYKVVEVSIDGLDAGERFQSDLCALGFDGWRLVSFHTERRRQLEPGSYRSGIYVGIMERELDDPSPAGV